MLVVCLEIFTFWYDPLFVDMENTIDSTWTHFWTLLCVNKSGTRTRITDENARSHRNDCDVKHEASFERYIKEMQWPLKPLAFEQSNGHEFSWYRFKQTKTQSGHYSMCNYLHSEIQMLPSVPDEYFEYLGNYPKCRHLNIHIDHLDKLCTCRNVQFTQTDANILC